MLKQNAQVNYYSYTNLSVIEQLKLRIYTCVRNVCKIIN